MAQSCYFLDSYPLYEHYHACWEFLDNEVDWSFHGKDATWFDISHVMRLFPHLTLDENYRLMCYLTSGFHGITGTIRALRKGIPSEPTVESIFSDPRVDFFLGKELTPPKESAKPMEAIYNDGTPEGYFEALLCSEFLRTLPGTESLFHNWTPILNQPPADYPSAWDTYLYRLETPHSVIGRLVSHLAGIFSLYRKWYGRFRWSGHHPLDPILL